MLSPSGRCRTKSLLVRISVENLDADRFPAYVAVPLASRLVIFLNRSRSAERPNVVVDQLVGGRQVRRKLSASRVTAWAFCGIGSSSLSMIGMPLRFGRTSMAGVAGHFPITLETVLVDRQHHSHHVARDLFRFLVVFVEMVLHVAIAAFHSK